MLGIHRQLQVSPKTWIHYFHCKHLYSSLYLLSFALFYFFYFCIGYRSKQSKMHCALSHKKWEWKLGLTHTVVVFTYSSVSSENLKVGWNKLFLGYDPQVRATVVPHLPLYSFFFSRAGYSPVTSLLINQLIMTSEICLYSAVDVLNAWGDELTCNHCCKCSGIASYLVMIEWVCLGKCIYTIYIHTYTCHNDYLDSFIH